MRLLLPLPLLLASCAPIGPVLDLDDDPVAYVEDLAYGRAVLERDLLSTDNRYAQQRLERYGLEEEWGGLFARDPVTRPLRRDDVQRLVDGQELVLDEAPSASLATDELPKWRVLTPPTTHPACRP